MLVAMARRRRLAEQASDDPFALPEPLLSSSVSENTSYVYLAAYSAGVEDGNNSACTLHSPGATLSFQQLAVTGGKCRLWQQYNTSGIVESIYYALKVGPAKTHLRFYCNSSACTSCYLTITSMCCLV